MTDGTDDVQGADDSRGTTGEKAQHGIAPGKASSSGGHNEDLIAELDAFAERRRAELWALPLAERKARQAQFFDFTGPTVGGPDDLIAELVAAMNTPVILEGRDLTPETLARLEALSMNLWPCERCGGWAARLGDTGPSQHLAEGLAGLNPERVLELANELAGVGWADGFEDECPPHAAHNRRELAAATAHDERLRLELIKAGGTPPPMFEELPPGTYRLTTSGKFLPIAEVYPPNEFLGLTAEPWPIREPWHLRHPRALGVALWAVVAIVGASTVLAILTAGSDVWGPGLLGTAVGAAALLATRKDRRGGTR